MGDFIGSLYETSIDYGAHPNTLAIRNHVQLGPDTTEQKRFDQGSIYPGDSFQVFRALTSAVEYSRGIALVLIHCLPSMTPTVVKPLRALQLEFARIMKIETPDAERQD